MTRPFAGRTAALATKHGKETILAPLLERELGVRVVVPPGLDTDRFGTFSGERPRVGDQLRAARAKADAGMQMVHGASLGIASEGSFGRHPGLPWFAAGFEIVLLVDAERGLTIVGEDLTVDTDYEARVVATVDEALRVHRGIDRETSALTVTAADRRGPLEGGLVLKALRDERDVTLAVTRILETSRHAFVATDMRAHLNARRRASILRAGEDLVRRAASPCPRCETPGFWRDGVKRGLPCAACGTPTGRPSHEILRCVACPYEDERAIAAAGAGASPAECPWCNP